MRTCLKIGELPLEPRDPEQVCTCSRCCGEIYEGEEYFTFDGMVYCQECFQDSAAEILLEQYGAEQHIAERNSDYDECY